MQTRDDGVSVPNQAPRLVREPKLLERIKYGSDLYDEVMDFLVFEALLLDDDRLSEWVGLFADDILYTVPVRQTVLRKDGRGFNKTMWLFEDIQSLKFRTDRMISSGSAFAEDPPSRCRRLLGSIVLYVTDAEREYFARGPFALLRNRGDHADTTIITGVREDILRHGDSGWTITQRYVMIDQTRLDTPSLGIFF